MLFEISVIKSQYIPYTAVKYKDIVLPSLSLILITSLVYDINYLLYLF